MCEFFTENRSVLLDGQLSVCTSIVHGELCAQIFTDVDVIELVLLVVVELIAVALIAVAMVVVVVIVVTVTVW